MPPKTAKSTSLMMRATLISVRPPEGIGFLPRFCMEPKTTQRPMTIRIAGALMSRPIMMLRMLPVSAMSPMSSKASPRSSEMAPMPDRVSSMVPLSNRVIREMSRVTDSRIARIRVSGVAPELRIASLTPAPRSGFAASELPKAGMGAR